MSEDVNCRKEYEKTVGLFSGAVMTKLTLPRCLKQSKEKRTLIENRKADELYIVEQCDRMVKASFDHHELFKGYIDQWKSAEKEYELQKLKDIHVIVKSEEKEKLWRECSAIFDQLFELTWKVRALQAKWNA